MSQTLTVNLPSDLYVRIKERADQAKRSIEEETLEMPRLRRKPPAPHSQPRRIRRPRIPHAEAEIRPA